MPTEAAETGAHRRVFGAGVVKGLRMAGIENPEVFLNAAKAERLERDLVGMIRKVFDSLPMAEPWTPSQVVAEMHRQTASKPDHRTVTACLGQLVERGLAKEPARGVFMRAYTKPQLTAIPPVPAPMQLEPRVEAHQPIKEQPPVTAAKPENKSESADFMGSLAAVTATLKGLGEQVSSLAREVDDVAIGVEEQVQRIHADSEKLRQLQALLKSIGQ